MSQPPQNGWGQQSGDPYGQPQGNGQDGYGQPSPNAAYGQDAYGQGGYGQDAYGQPSPNAGYSDYGQGSPNSGYAPSYGDGAQGAAPQQGEKKSGSKLPLLICAGCAVLALIVGIIGGGIFLFTRGGEEDPPTGGGDTTTTQEETPDPDGTTEPEGGDDTTEPEGGDDTTEPAGDGDKGTRENPYGAGETFVLPDTEDGELEISFGNVNWDATEEIKETNQFNEDPGEGEVHIMVPVTLTYRGSGSVEPLLLLSTNYVADSGNSYMSAPLVVPNDAMDVGELYDGGTGEFNIPFTIPTDAVQKGSFNVSVLLDFDGEEVWVAAE